MLVKGGPSVLWVMGPSFFRPMESYVPLFNLLWSFINGFVWLSVSRYSTFWGAFYLHGLTLIPTWMNITSIIIWVRSWNCHCLVTWFCYQLIAKPGNKTATVSWPDPYVVSNYLSTPKLEVWEWISNFIPNFTMHLVTYPCWIDVCPCW